MKDDGKISEVRKTNTNLLHDKLFVSQCLLCQLYLFKDGFGSQKLMPVNLYSALSFNVKKEHSYPTGIDHNNHY